MSSKPGGRAFGFRVGRIAGIAIHVDPSLAIIFALITYALGSLQFPVWHPDWPALVTWTTALAAAFLFFVSILVHELSHALVGRAKGIPVNAITLFIFGGVAQLESEPHTWRAELWMAVAGPITSFVLGVSFLFLAGIFAGPVDLEQGEAALAQLNPVSTLLVWLGPVNIILALFNLVPGFPLDGGRVLRAILWGASGDLMQATQWASRLGQGFAWLLIMLGVAMMLGVQVPFFGSGVFPGMWLALIGWFLNNAALMSYRQLLVSEALHGVPVARLMRRDLLSVNPAMSVETLIDERLMRSDQRAFPVIDDGHLLGLVCLHDIRRTPREAWPATRVGDIMTPAERLASIGTDTDAAQALQRLSREGVNQLPVIDHGRLVGLIQREDILKWLSLYGGRMRP
ncbi:MAG: CBS domain-containing protein [Gammaproteobacteria bacterium]|nr:CBS domain-containing protein [Gammaproteobacteria bacterium]NIP90153.1 CBS domain-containing protein [Gammaproteobacteria bacterium]NIR24945.1 CBS domain-containing protein [Gammaproteobacteria bacterium]NIS06613.1 CBS domain-containing protein [Gammaproteobacteria bacterium]NIU40431.1 CBS domain-containing protein [Gammaproteobacteria bacterium]